MSIRSPKSALNPIALEFLFRPQKKPIRDWQDRVVKRLDLTALGC